jgi:PAS domain S-box-containing protein
VTADSSWLELAYDAIIVRERDGRVVQWNRAAAERYGYGSDEAVGRTIDDLFERTYSDRSVNHALPDKGIWEGEVCITLRDGRVLEGPCKVAVTAGSQIIEVHGPMTSRTDTDLRLVIDHMPGLVSYIDDQLRYRFANRVYTDWFGTSEQEVIGAKVESVLGKDAFARVRTQMENALGGELMQFDTFLPYARGMWKYVTVTYVPDKDARTGKVRGFVVLVEDNTARHEAEQALRRSESHYRQIVETAHEGIWMIGMDARTVFANQRMAELLGTTVDRMVGDSSFRYVFEEEAEEAQRLFTSKMQGDREPFEYRLRRADGTAIRTRISGVPMTDEQGNVTGILGMFTDITEAYAAEHALRESEERFRTLLANMPDIVSRFDREGRFLYISPAVEKATGLPASAFLGRSHGESGVPEPLASYLSDRLAQIVDSGIAATVDFDMPAPGGLLRRYHGLGVPEFGADGSVKTVLTIVHDVTEHRRAEEALRRSNADLEQFAYAAAHDLQEPLRVVGTYTELFLKRYAKPDDPGAKQVSSFILNGVRQLQSLVRDLLAYSRAVHEEPQRLGPVSLDEALDQAITALDGFNESSVAHIEREPLPVAIGDRGQIAQVFQNVLSNAFKYKQPGKAPSVRVWAERSASEWIISVRDRGIGFDPIYAERIFGLFKRLHRDAYPGTGVGLGICKRIVERHGGRIWAESEGNGLGSTFRFTLKAEDDGL